MQNQPKETFPSKEFETARSGLASGRSEGKLIRGKRSKLLIDVTAPKTVTTKSN